MGCRPTALDDKKVDFATVNVEQMLLAFLDVADKQVNIIKDGSGGVDKANRSAFKIH